MEAIVFSSLMAFVLVSPLYIRQIIQEEERKHRVMFKPQL